ncbi:AI-2E family transporter [Phaeobacter gallaeciensis]|uniref:AI-2E family transporter n=2 Tax=Roseobacteraceae TaxID=2854170 RepID=A0A366X340_9RHOB|nr:MULTISPECIES: AI-2E family transporter [Roseobacteraceae]MBT3139457.1 AI-2E family transporter [Falsiruegeria litorea]MBT8167001.1 AI-2E family transporter [Falsiruegeria litorea]RBW57351.1 AI-2E family transporter [Phaeobacter gallaeciensis]
MALSAKDQVRYWGVVAAVFVLVLWFLGDVLLPFVIGGAIAYFIDPVADRLERWGLSRMAATAVITVVSVLIFVILVLMVVPALITQLIDLIDVLPQLFRDLRTFVDQKFPSLLDRESNTHQILVTLGETLKSKTGELLQTLVGSVGSAINIVVLLVIVPVVAVYLLLDWDNMIERIDFLVPRDHSPVIRQLATDVDSVLASFVRGMGTVCLILGTYYAVALMLVGLQFGLIVGFIAGLVTFIPYLGALIGGALAIGLALFQFWGDWTSIGIVGAIFAFGQVIEGNYLTPKLVGSSVGLHPVWLLLALSVFGALFGFVGMLIAVPVAAALGVLARFGTAQYLSSRLYQGITGQDAE